MFIIIDKNTNKITQTASVNYGIRINENELLQEVEDDFETKFKTAHTYELIFINGLVTDITVTQTKADYEANLPIVTPPKTEIELLQEANIELKTKLETSDRVSTETSVMLQELVEILMEMEVI